MNRINRKTCAWMLAAMLLLLACNFPLMGAGTPSEPEEPAVETVTVAPAEPEATSESPALPTAEPKPEVAFQGVRFNYDQSLAGSITPELVEPMAEPDMPEWAGNPQYLLFAFEQYPLQDTFHEPVINFYRVDKLAEYSPMSMEIISELKTYLANPSQDSSKPIPFLPFWNAGQMMHAKPVILEFQSGKGVRFLTQYAQSFYPINNTSMFYTFQGLSSDESWYVSAVLPVNHATLPNNDQPPGGDYEAFAANYPVYIQEVRAALDSQDDGSFNPSLVILDEMIRSITLE